MLTRKERASGQKDLFILLSLCLKTLLVLFIIAHKKAFARMEPQWNLWDFWLPCALNLIQGDAIHENMSTVWSASESRWICSWTSCVQLPAVLSTPFIMQHKYWSFYATIPNVDSERIPVHNRMCSDAVVAHKYPKVAISRQIETTLR